MLFKRTTRQSHATLCDLCRNLFCGDLVTETSHVQLFVRPRSTDRDSDKTRQYEWHESFLSLESAAKNGCHLCVQACGALTKKQLALLRPDIHDEEQSKSTSSPHHIDVKMHRGGSAIGELCLDEEPNFDLSLYFSFTSSTLQQKNPSWKFGITCILKPEKGKPI